MNLSMYRLLVPCLIVPALACQSMSVAGLAQQSSANTTNNAKSQKQKAPPPDRSVFTNSKLVTSVPQLPDFPAYTGKIEYSLCRSFPTAGRGAYMIIARTQETADQVLTWYKQSLPMQGWTLLPRQTHDSKVGAESKQGSTAQLSASPINEAPWRCRLVINYASGPGAQSNAPEK